MLYARTPKVTPTRVSMVLTMQPVAVSNEGQKENKIMYRELILIAISAGLIVFCIDAYNNHWYSKLCSAHRCIVEYRIRSLDSRDINWLLEHTGKFVELNNELYVTNVDTMSSVGVIHHRRAFNILVDKMGGYYA